MLMLPLRSGGDNPGSDIYRDVAKQYGIPVFDGYRAISKLSKSLWAERKTSCSMILFI